MYYMGFLIEERTVLKSTIQEDSYTIEGTQPAYAICNINGEITYGMKSSLQAAKKAIETNRKRWLSEQTKRLIA